ncbi:MAG: sulfurtransferase [Planctomycetaceae bacterium]|nr:sulfurtransferase [Planctomycetaceae bacterium]
MSQATVTISPKEFVELKRTGKTLDLIDVRTPAEYRGVHAEGARNIPLDRLDAARLSREKKGDEPIYLICHTGSRASKACEMFQATGNTNVVSVEGGTNAWEEAGLPVVRGKKAISLERQVRIAAGSIVLLGIALGFLVDEYLFGLSGFVGAGLVFAGITDTCGMGMLLARMPWNQVA